MDSRNALRLAGLAGIVFVVVSLVATFIIPPPPSADDSPQKFLDWFSDHRNLQLTAMVMNLLSVIPALVFAAGFWRILRRIDGDEGVLALAAIFGFILTGAMATLGAAWFGGLAFLSDGHGLEAQSAHDLSIIGGIFYQATYAPLLVMTGLSGYLFAMKGTLPRWVGWIGLAAALLELIGLFAFADSGAFSPFGPFALLGFLGFTVYVLIVSIFMLRTKESG